MDTSKLAQWLNLIAALGVLAGLLLVAFEIRQASEITFAEARSQLLSDYQMGSMSTYGPEIGALFIKSIQNPTQLTDEEAFKVSEYLVAVTSTVNKHVVLYYDFGWATEPTDDIEDMADYYLAGAFARSWWLENTYWLHPKLVEVVEQYFDENPVTTSWEYGDRIKSRLSSDAFQTTGQEPQ